MATRAAVAGGFVGRARERQQLQRALSDADAGRGGTVLVAGEPGIGKSRLVAEVAREATLADALVVTGRCATDAPPYWPWRQALRQLGAGSVLDGDDIEDEDDRTGARLRRFDAVASRLDEAADGRTLVVVLDDLQWADRPALRLLAFVGRQVADARVLVLGTYRDTEVTAEHPLREVLRDLGSAASVLVLGGLAPAEVGQLLTEDGVASDDATVAAVHTRTGGNPFFVRELGHVLHRIPGDPSEVPLPPAAVELIRHRLRDADDDTRRLLVAAAVAGSARELALLGEVVGRPAVDLIAPAEEAVAMRLLEPDGTGYRFQHDLVREGILQTVPVADRAAIHWSLATSMEVATDPARIESAARHAQAGLVVGEPDRAVELTLRAADRAMADLAFEVAAHHLGWLLTEVDVGSGHPRLDPVELRLALGEARLLAGDWKAAGDAYESAAQLARSADRADDLARAALGFGAGLGGFEVRMVDSRQIGLLEEAATRLRGTGSRWAPLVLARLSVALSFVEGVDRRRELSREALALAEQNGDPAAVAHALAAWCDAVAGPDHVDERLGAAERVVALGAEAASDDLVLLGHRLAIVALLERGDLAEATVHMAAFERIVSRRRLPIVAWYVPLWQGMRALLLGDLDIAERAAAAAAGVGARAGSDNAQMLSDTLRLSVILARGDEDPLLDEARAFLAELLQGNPGLTTARAALLGLALHNGDEAEVRRQLDTIVALGFGQRDSEWLGTVVTAAEACLALGDREVGRLVAAKLEPYEHLYVVGGIGAAIEGAVQEYLGALDLLVGKVDRGRSRLAEVVEAYESIGAPLLAARARGRLGDAVSPPFGTPAPTSATFRRDGDVWLLRFDGGEARLRDAKGLRDIAALLARPHQELHVSDLTGGGVVVTSTGDEAIDVQAKEAYRRRVVELEAEIADADDANDGERAARAREELDFLVEELSRAVGLGGRVRRSTDDEERARQAVRARVRWALGRLEEALPAMARHLEVSMRTGTFCVYAPEHDIGWDLG